MSLKGFHIIFLVFAVLTALGFYAWTQVMIDDAKAMQVVGLGQASGVSGVVLLLYTAWFILIKGKSIKVS
jgi:hypothetical protein